MDRGCFSISERSLFFLTQACFAHFGHQQLIRAGYRNHTSPCGGKILAREGSENLACGHEAYDADAGPFDCLSSSLFTVYEGENAGYGCICAAHGIDRAQRGPARGYHVFYYCDIISYSDRSLKKFSHAVSLGLLSDGECAQRMA